MGIAHRIHLGTADVGLCLNCGVLAAKDTERRKHRDYHGAQDVAPVVDQVVGALGQLALNIYLRPDAGRALFEKVWMEAIKNDTDTTDVPGYHLDVKTTLRQYRNTPIGTFSLPVRPIERHVGWTYVLALLDLPKLGWEADVLLVGFCEEHRLGPQATEGTFGPNEWSEGAFVTAPKDLRPISELNP